jgi:phage regulator Rha-like protein
MLIQYIDNEPRISHKIIAKETENKDISIRKLIDKQKDALNLFGNLSFKMTSLNRTTKDGVSRGAVDEKVYFLNEQQATLLLTFMRNNEIVIKFKVRLVQEFYKMRESLKSQNFDLTKLEERARVLEISEKEYGIFERVFYKLGITRKEELAITSNRAVKKETGVDFLEISEKKGLSTTEKYFTVTELCEIVRNGDFSEEAKKVVSTKNGEKPRPQNLNKLLEKEGFQFRENEIWKATEKGQEFSDFVQNKSKHSEKTVFHTVWKKEILNKLFLKKQI